MNAKNVTRTATHLINDIVRFVGRDNPEIGERYRNTVASEFYGLSDIVTFKRASMRLPANVQEMSLKGFKGYTLRIMRHSDGITYLLSAHRPGLTEAMKNRQTRVGINEVRG